MSEYVIETTKLTKRYGSQASVSEVDMHVKKGRIYGLLGRNGAGKTTTMKMLLRLTTPTSGKVRILGKDMQKNSENILPQIGSLIESPGFYPNLTATENLRIFAELRGIKNRRCIQEALALVGLPYRDKKLFSQYSLGMKQRLAIALAVMHNPDLLILDEPINGLDPIGIAEIRSFIRELCDIQGKTILISSHILSEIALLADDIGIIHNGVLLEEGSLAELEQKNHRYVHFEVSDSSKAAQIAAGVLHTNNFEICDHHNLKLLGANLPVGLLNRAFIQNGLEVSEAHLCVDTLEDYFKRVTGGEGLA
ncbi:ABC transporter ATP-binding protein [Enterococcus sp. 669A]|uniref:ABC transporter ATP-binding protein n=1 Tax=Candidatus Enterococcus moelleringii TaxID=2815325 RepID=A0ABS3L7H1_9ENTE|nr:ABC transporter ATP-binding protein [Enterococcus sp. 669A]MBO1305572.1 ABC transporter ATP-binding protein [Enterococcus sp. 669A]